MKKIYEVTSEYDFTSDVLVSLERPILVENRIFRTEKTGVLADDELISFISVSSVWVSYTNSYYTPALYRESETQLGILYSHENEERSSRNREGQC